MELTSFWHYFVVGVLLLGSTYGENTTQSSLIGILITNNSIALAFSSNQTHNLNANLTDLDLNSTESSTKASCPPPQYITVPSICSSDNRLTVGLAVGLSVTIYTLLIILCSFCLFVKYSTDGSFGRQNIFKKESARKHDIDNFYEEPAPRNKSVFYYPDPSHPEPDVKIPQRTPTFRQRARIVIDQHMGHRTLPRSLKLTITKQKNPDPYQYFSSVTKTKSPDPSQYFNTLTKKARLNDYRTRKHSISLPKDLNVQVGNLDTPEHNPYIINKAGGSSYPQQHTRNSSNASSVELSKQHLDEINLGIFSPKGTSENVQDRHGYDKKTQNTDAQDTERKTSTYRKHISTHYDEPSVQQEGNASTPNTHGQNQNGPSHQQYGMGQATGYNPDFPNQYVRKNKSSNSLLANNLGKQENSTLPGNVNYLPNQSNTMLPNQNNTMLPNQSNTMLLNQDSMGPNTMVVSAVMEPRPPNEIDFLPPPPDEFDFPPPPIVDDQLLPPPPSVNDRSSPNLVNHQNMMSYDGRNSPNTRPIAPSVPTSQGFVNQQDNLPPPPTCGMNQNKKSYAKVLPVNGNII